jgi:hypothetical protein
MSSMYRMSIVGLAAALGAAAWAGPARAWMLSSTGPVVAIMGEELFLGEARGYLDGSGTMTIRSQRNPELTCRGEFTSSAELGGLGRLRCSNGATGTFRFKRLTLRKGYGVGSYAKRPMNFTYGLTAEESAPYLKLPPGKKLDLGGKTPALVAASAK